MNMLEYLKDRLLYNDSHIDEFANLPMYLALYSVEHIFVYNYHQNYQSYLHQVFLHYCSYLDKQQHIS